ncbi:hypothetical protein [Staphylococcus hyicus]|uniref:hypothetical protein n=1 Tax=Staphylococcus hyicus TaxID=1284 RepID=UPI00208E8109|nr:hypothetical protein [Staphylococcus hyicus]MCO4332500.1 hypothetical protein [Staphylococcus hyicus]MCO4334900.1 hypothetical protein [Staphylococcus hyicus]
MNTIIASIISSSVIASIVTGLLSYRNTNKTIHAQIVANARHQWIQEVRSLSSEYITIVGNIATLIEKENERNFDNFSESVLNECHDLLRDLLKIKNKISLYFGTNKTYEKGYIKTKTVHELDQENIEINDVIEQTYDNVKEFIESINKEIQKGKVNHKQINDSCDVIVLDLYMFQGSISSYLKSEWYKTKKMK